MGVLFRFNCYDSNSERSAVHAFWDIKTGTIYLQAKRMPPNPPSATTQYLIHDSISWYDRTQMLPTDLGPLPAEKSYKKIH
jgi:hypothetical protein